MANIAFLIITVVSLPGSSELIKICMPEKGFESQSELTKEITPKGMILEH